MNYKIENIHYTEPLNEFYAAIKDENNETIYEDTLDNCVKWIQNKLKEHNDCNGFYF